MARVWLWFWGLVWLGLGLLARADSWQRVAPPPKDLLGRELPPGVGAAFCYVPPWKGFLIYGGYWPSYTNAAWLYRPQSGQWELLWPCDQWGWDTKTNSGYVRLPRQVHWSPDRPGPARGMAAVYYPPSGKVYLIGGHPGDERHWFGNTRVGTWELDPKRRRFRFVTAQGPRGLTKAVYASRERVIVAAPQRGDRGGKSVTWVFEPRRRRWLPRGLNGGPRPTPHAAWAYDAATGLCVYFNALGETWTYDVRSDRWEQRRPAEAPPPRWHAAAAYHPRRKQVVLFGGVGLRNGTADKVYGYGSRVWRDRDGVYYRDTWAYDAAQNRWRQLDPAPPADTPSVHDACAWDSDAQVLVCYDPVQGFLSLGAAPGYRRLRRGPELVVSSQWRKHMARQVPPVADSAVRAWRRVLKQLPADTWADPGVRSPSFGDTSFDYHAEADCLYWIGGCLGAAAGTYEDYSYTNQVVVFDLQVGKWQLRRPNQPWLTPQGAALRPGNGCGRGFCYDSKRKLVWTLGGVTGVGLAGARGMQAYDLLRDRFFSPTSSTRGWGSNCGMVYVPRLDWLLAVSGGYQPVDTFAFSPERRRWVARAPHPPKRSQYARVMYDPALGVLLLAQVPKQGWRPGQLVSRDQMIRLMKQHGWHNKVFVYRLRQNDWQELRVEGAEALDDLALEAVALDSRHRCLVALHQQGDRRGPVTAWVLDLERRRWRRGASTPPVGRIHAGSFVYAQRHNVLVLAAGRQLYLYRCRGGYPE